MAPRVEFQGLEKDTKLQWHVAAGGSRAYLCRFGEGLARERDAEVLNNEAAESHFMISAFKSALLLGGQGLFQTEAVGRVFLGALPKLPEWVVQLNLAGTDDTSDTSAAYDWMGALFRHRMLLRAAADAHLALSNPHEAGTFVYRGLEWLVLGEGRSWDELAGDIGVSTKEVRSFKKLANVDYGVRHASRSGKRLRADVHNYGTWVCALIDAINATRSRLEPKYKVADSSTVAEAVMAAIPLLPFD